MHPHLPLTATCIAGAPEIDDTAKFIAESPLADTKAPTTAPSPFWASYGAQASEDANMEQQSFTMTTSPP
eukprot:7302437-Lingulodinium_polyedra.AAC.1